MSSTGKLPVLEHLSVHYNMDLCLIYSISQIRKACRHTRAGYVCAAKCYVHEPASHICCCFCMVPTEECNETRCTDVPHELRLAVLRTNICMGGNALAPTD